MKLLGKNIIVRRPALNDADYSFRWFSDPYVTRYLPLAGKGNIPLEKCREHIKIVMSQERPEFSVTIDSIDGQTIGCGGFRNFKEGESAEISLVIGETSFWAKGVGREAMTLLLNYGFTQLALSEVWLVVRQDNEHAVSLFSSLGFKQTELILNAVVIEGVPKNKLKMTLSKSKWKNGTNE